MLSKLIDDWFMSKISDVFNIVVCPEGSIATADFLFILRFMWIYPLEYTYPPRIIYRNSVMIIAM